MSITLSKTETKLLQGAAERDGSLEFPESTKPTARERLLGRFIKDELAFEQDGTHRLTPAGYRAVGLRPPRGKRVEAPAHESPSQRAPGETAAPRSTKGAMILELLGRGEGASLVELTEATGWLPHTTRAALSRLRSSGKPLSKAKREDGTTCYRLVADEQKPARAARRARAEAPVEATA